MSLHHICYQNEIPAELTENLVDIYQSVFCLTDYFSLYHDPAKTQALAIYSERQLPDHVIFYTISGKEALVLNELFQINFGHLDYFAKFLFTNYPEVRTIHINKFKSDLGNLSFPYKIWHVSHDNVVKLPATMAEYRAQLGKRTRANLSNYYNKLRREFPDFSFSIVTGKEIDPAVITEIIDMHRSRMLDKKSSSAIDAERERKIIQLARSHGIAGLITIKGKIAAGTICYEAGRHCFSDVIAHDPAYNRYSIGRICIYLLIEALIDRETGFFHMGFGEADYKNRMGSEMHDIYHASIFRTKFHEITGKIKYVSKYENIKLYTNMIKYNYLKRFKEMFKNKVGTG